MKRSHLLIGVAVAGVLLALAAGLSGCGGDGGPAGTSASGLVRDATTGGAVAAATVFVGSNSAPTDGDGAYTVHGCEPGSWNLQCVATGYQSFPAPGPLQVLLQEGSNSIQTILLVPAGQIPPPVP